MKKLAVVLLSSCSLLSGCGSKVSGADQNQLEKQLIKRVDQDKRISKEGKDIIKKSGILKYEVKTYNDKMDVKKIAIDDVEFEDQQPYIKLTIKKKNKKGKYLISCGINNRTEKKCDGINDDYLLNVISKSARKQIDPMLKKAFGSKTPFYYAVAKPGKKVNAEMLKSGDWEYSKYMGKVPVTLAIKLKEKPDQKVYEKMLKFLKSFQNKKDVKIELITFYYMTKPLADYKSTDEVKALITDQDSINKLRSIKDMKKFEPKEGIWTYQYWHDIMIQQHS